MAEVWQITDSDDKAEDTAVKSGVGKQSKVEGSPFVQTGEVITPFLHDPSYKQVWINHNTPPPGIPRLLKMIKNGQLNSRDLDILTCLYNCKFLTRHQIFQLCFAETSYTRAKARLKVLFDYRLISAFCWGPNEQSVSNIVVYCLGARGEELLRHYRGLNTKRWNESFNTREMEYIFKVLVVNEWFIRLMENSLTATNNNGLQDFKLEPALRAGRKRVVPTGMFRYKNEKERTFLLEVVRNVDSLGDSLNYYGGYYRSLEEEQEKPILLFVVQEEAQALQIWNLIDERGLAFIPARFTTDARFVGLKLWEHGAAFKVVSEGIRDVEPDLFKH